MSSLSRDFIIVSAFGRGHWLARKLAKNKFNTALVDVTKHLGKSENSDWLGPFGQFRDPVYESEDWSFLSDEIRLQAQPTGFTFWLPRGPMELKGPLAEFSSQVNNINIEVLDFFKQIKEKAWISSPLLSQKTFSKSWLYQFSHYFASNIYFDHFDSRSTYSGERKPLSLYSDFFNHSIDLSDIENSFSACAKDGVEVFSDSKIIDFSTSANKIEGIEISSERSGVQTAQNFVWCLTSNEAENFHERVLANLYFKKVLKPSWSWIKFKLNISGGPELMVLPDYFCLLRDIKQPWTHTNLCVFNRDPNDKNKFDVWVRVSALRSFQRSYLTEMADDILKDLKRRIPAVSVQLDSMPMEFDCNQEERGAARFPVYDENGLRGFKKKNWSNISYASPEDYPSLDHSGRIFWLKKILQRELEKRQKLLAQKQGESRDKPIHPA